MAVAQLRSTKAGPAGPATLPSRSEPIICGASTLNEGRPGRAGNSTPSRRTARLCGFAQRRPARPGRQLHIHLRLLGPPLGRSTKAGPAGPATPARPFPPRGSRFLRSTKAGPAGPATREVSAPEAEERLRRSTKAGPAGPATPPHIYSRDNAPHGQHARIYRRRGEATRLLLGVFGFQGSLEVRSATGPRARPIPGICVGRAWFEPPGSALRNDR